MRRRCVLSGHDLHIDLGVERLLTGRQPVRERGILGHTGSVSPVSVESRVRAGACAAIVVLTSVGVGGGGCSLGFDQFDPVAAGDADSSVSDATAAGDGAGDTLAVDADSGTVDDTGDLSETGSEAGCAGMQGCLSTATSCGMPCVQTYQQCVGACGMGDFQCRQQCKSAEQSCRASCTNACTMCTMNAGCPSQSACQTASMM
jgi:hypothetical protein